MSVPASRRAVSRCRYAHAAPSSTVQPYKPMGPAATIACSTLHPASALGALAGCTELGSARPCWPNGSVALRVTSRARSQQGRLKEIFAGNSLIFGLVLLCSMVCIGPFSPCHLQGFFSLDCTCVSVLVYTLKIGLTSLKERCLLLQKSCVLFCFVF